MNEPTNLQIIRDGAGEPAFVVVPYADWIAFRNRDEGAVPHAVVNLVFDNEWSPMRAWREFLGLTQAEVATRLGVTQAAYAQTEASSSPRKTTLRKVADALGLTLEQLDF
jgi:DNA-binding XRE family transcriptional regulator